MTARRLWMESLLDAERTKHQKELLEHRRLCDVQMQDKDKPGKKMTLHPCLLMMPDEPWV